MQLSTVLTPLGCVGIIFLIASIFLDDRSDSMISLGVILALGLPIGILLKVYEKIKNTRISNESFSPPNKFLKILRLILYAITVIAIIAYAMYMFALMGYS